LVCKAWQVPLSLSAKNAPNGSPIAFLSGEIRKINMNSIREVLRLHLIANLSARKIQGATGVDRTTVQE